MIRASDTLPKGRDSLSGSVRSKGSAVLAFEDAPNPSHPNTSGATKQAQPVVIALLASHLATAAIAMLLTFLVLR